MKLKNIGIEAGAGCGKTTRIINDIQQGLKDGLFDIDKIAVITFTKKAASELKSRISLMLQEAVGKGNIKLEKHLKNLGNANISTIHSFCESLLKQRPIEAKIDPGFKVIDESEQEQFLDEVYEQWLKIKLKEDSDFFVKLVIDIGKDLKHGDKQGYDNSFMSIIKTALQYRELDLFIPEKPEDLNTLLQNLITETENFVNECDNKNLRLKLLDYISILQMAKSGNFEKYYPEIAKTSLSSTGGNVYKEKRQAWTKLRDTYVFKMTYSPRYPEIKKLYDEINLYIKDFISFYRESMRKRGVMDFDEILFKTQKLLANNKQVRQYFKEKFTYLFIDEFQDTDPTQVKILFCLAEKPDKFEKNWKNIEIDEGKIYVVADPKQSIYRFRRADIEIYTKAINKITKGKYEFLNINYRSCTDIIDWVNDFFVTRIKKPKKGNYQADYVPLKHNKKEKGQVIYVKPDLKHDNIKNVKKGHAQVIEAKLTACWIKDFVAKTSYDYKDIMVLFKRKVNFQMTADYLDELNIPYEMVGATTYFGRGEILDILNLLSAIANPLDQVSILAALKGPFFSISDKNLYIWKSNENSFDYRTAEKKNDIVANALHELLSLYKQSFKIPPFVMIQNLLEEKGILSSYMALHRGKQKVLNILKAIEILRTLESLPFCDAVYEFCEKVKKNIEMADFSPKSGNVNAVQLMTIHKSKGLEQKVVYLADSTSSNTVSNDVFIDNQHGKVVYKVSKDYLTPEYLAMEEFDKLRNDAETERLRYVASTRAKEVFVINRVDFDKFNKTFVAPFFLGKECVCEKIDISNVSISTGKKIKTPELKAEPIFEDQLQRIIKDIPEAFKKAQEPSIDIESPSKVQVHDDDDQDDDTSINIEVVYNQDTSDYRIESKSTAEIGTLAHKLMELDPDNLEVAAKTLIENEKATISPKELIKIVKSLHNEELHQRIKNAKTVLKEVPIKFKANDTYYDGNIDLLFQEDDGWVLADYKTIKVSNSDEEKKLKQKYQGQMQVYADGLKQLGLKVKDCILLSC